MECWPGCWGLDGCLGGLILIACVLGCAGWPALYGCLGLDGGGIMRGMWICWTLVLVESGRGAGLSGLRVTPEKETKK